MNKILLATTALVATAGFAAADVSLSGSAEMGLVDLGGATDVAFHSDMDVRFTLSGETDNGLTFGATIDLDEVADGISNAGGSDAVFISGSFGTLTLGDTDGAFDWAMQEVGIGSAIIDDHTTHAGFAFNSGLDGSAGGNVLRYDNTFGDLSVAVSAELDAAAGDDALGFGVKYNAALAGVDLGLGLGFQDNGVVDGWGVSVDAKFANGLRAIVNHSDGGGVEHTGLGLGYTSGALTVSANYGEFSGAVVQDGYGFAVNYDLGGAAVQFGYGSDRQDSDGLATGEASWSLGLAMSF